MTQHDINFVAEFLRDNFNHFTLVRMMWSFVNGSDDFMCLIHVKRICKSKTFHCCVKGDMYIILWFTENVMLWNLLFAIQTICQLWKYLEPLPILTFRWRRDFSKTFFGPTYNFICYLNKNNMFFYIFFFFLWFRMMKIPFQNWWQTKTRSPGLSWRKLDR